MTRVAPDSAGHGTASSQVRAATPGDLPVIAAVHAEAFRGFFLAELGKAFLVAYYRTVLKYPEGILLVAVQNSTVVGFVGGFIEPDEFYRFMSRRKVHFAIPAGLGLLRNPRLLKRLFNRSRRVISGEKQLQDRVERSCELSSLAVDPGTTRQGVGKKLVLQFVAEATRRDARNVFLTTDAVGNEKVNRFYQELGFQRSGTFEMDGRREMNEYAFQIGARCGVEKGDDAGTSAE